MSTWPAFDGRPRGCCSSGRPRRRRAVFRTEKRRNPMTGKTYPWIVRATAMVNHFYFYCVDDDFGPFFFKFCSYFPYNAKLCINGHEWAKRQAAKAGIASRRSTTASLRVRTRPLCSRSATGSAGRQDRRLAPQVAGPAAPSVHRRGPARRLPLRHLDPAGRVLPDPGPRPAPVRAGLLRGGHPRQPRPRPPRPGAPDLRAAGHPPDPGPVPDPGHHRGRDPVAARRLQAHQDQAVLTRKEIALRTETTINDTRDFGIGKRLDNLPALREIGFRANRRLLDVQRISSDPHRRRRLQPDLRPHPVDGQRAPALRFDDPVIRPCSPRSSCCLLPAGFSNRDLRALAPLLGLPADTMTAGRMTYDLRRLRLHGLIERIPRTHRYQVTDFGLNAAVVLHRVSRPLHHHRHGRAEHHQLPGTPRRQTPTRRRKTRPCA